MDTVERLQSAVKWLTRDGFLTTASYVQDAADAIKQRDDEITRLRADLALAQGQRDASEREIERLRDENAGLRKDAERYQWLRSFATQKTAWDIYGDGGHWMIAFFSKDSRLSVDAAIDAAMQKGE